MTSNPIFTNNALYKMKYFGLSEADALDAYNHGHRESSALPGTDQVVRKYNGYEVGIIYSYGKLDAKYRIVSVWKRYRR